LRGEPYVVTEKEIGQALRVVTNQMNIILTDQTVVLDF